MYILTRLFLKYQLKLAIDTLTRMYNAIVLPHFNYADIVLDSASAASKFQLQSRQTRSARLIIGSGPRTSRNPMYKSLSWLSLQHRQDFQMSQ